MNLFARKEIVGSLSNQVKVLEGAITCELNSQDVEVSRISAEIQVDIDASEQELARLYGFIIAKREKRTAAVREEGLGRLDEMQRGLVDVKRKLDVINAPILTLPNEITAEFFSCRVLMGGNLKTMLLVCKRWTTLAYSSPRLWSRIAVTDLDTYEIRLKGALICYSASDLRWLKSSCQG